MHSDVHHFLHSKQIEKHMVYFKSLQQVSST